MMSVTLNKQQPQSGYTGCACRDCMDTTVSGDVTKPELCGLCEDAGCESFTVEAMQASDVTAGHFECQRDDAYGDE
ncbi:hypothetical protein AB0942_33195 [Streptomyces nodosus]|uniref:hypothetical protein n=1 Tax=Streptomyces nodosus TaxID=40318 RepID=UPI003455A868